MSIGNRIAKRLFDVCFSAIGILTIWPVIVICVIIASIDSRAIGLYRQTRVGRGGKLFNVLKIRTMYAEKGDQESTITTAHDGRITATGRWFRRYKLDELPQLWNVLTGQMSFVGPRPDVPGYADRLVGAQRRMLQLQPGITGPATIKYVNEEDILSKQSDPRYFNDTVVYPDKVNININYLDNYSLLNDIRYILMTIKIIGVPADLTYTIGSDQKIEGAPDLDVDRVLDH